MVSSTSSAKTQFALAKLEAKEWYKRSSVEIKDKLKSLGEEFNGYLLYLTGLIEFNDREILKLKNVVNSYKYVISVFDTRSKLTNQVFEEETVVPSEGMNPMNQGVVMLESKDGKIFEIIWLTNSPIKMYFPDFSSTRTLALPTKTEKILTKYIGVDKISVSKFTDLGVVENEMGLPIQLFALTIRAEQTARKKSLELTSVENGNVIKSINGQKNIVVLAVLIKLLSLKLIN